MDRLIEKAHQVDARQTARRRCAPALPAPAVDLRPQDMTGNPQARQKGYREGAASKMEGQVTGGRRRPYPNSGKVLALHQGLHIPHKAESLLLSAVLALAWTALVCQAGRVIPLLILVRC
jgi:hypothetical protein